MALVIRKKGDVDSFIMIHPRPRMAPCNDSPRVTILLLFFPKDGSCNYPGADADQVPNLLGAHFLTVVSRVDGTDHMMS